jgi:hypothetical protein
MWSKIAAPGWRADRQAQSSRVDVALVNVRAPEVAIVMQGSGLEQKGEGKDCVGDRILRSGPGSTPDWRGQPERSLDENAELLSEFG